MTPLVDGTALFLAAFVASFTWIAWIGLAFPPVDLRATCGCGFCFSRAILLEVSKQNSQQPLVENGNTVQSIVMIMFTCVENNKK